MSNLTNSSILSLTLSNIQEQMIIYGMPLILFFGCGGNMINCGVFLQKNLRSNSCSIYLIASSISYTILLGFALSKVLYSGFNIDPLTYSLVYCKIRPYLISSLFMISRTYIVLACIDRYALCSRHVRIRAFSRIQIALRLLPIIIIIWIFIPIHIAIFNTIVSNRCIMPGLYSLLYAVYAVICAGILPPSLMIIFSLLTYRNLQLMRQRIVPIGTTQNSYVRIKKIDYQIIKMLFVEVTIYFITTLPFPINTVYGAVTMNIVKSRDRAAIENFLTFLAASILQYLNASAAMYSNLATSTAFRSEFKKLIINCIRLDCIFKANVSNRPVPAVGRHINNAYEDYITVKKQKINASLVGEATFEPTHTNKVI